MLKKLLFFLLLFASVLTVDAQVFSKTVFSLSNDLKSIQSIKVVFDKTVVFIEKEGSINLDRLSINGAISYYDNFDGKDKNGKIKSLGNLRFNYYDVFDGADKAGKLKAINDVSVNYYDRFDGTEKNGKIKSIGNIAINYYDVFDGSYKQGKVKSVGPVVITYFDNFDSASRAGQIKAVTGNTENISVKTVVAYDDLDGSQSFDREKREIARKLKRRGVDLAIISEATGISIQELNRL